MPAGDARGGADGRKELVAKELVELTGGYRESTSVLGRFVARLPSPRNVGPCVGGGGRGVGILAGDPGGVPGQRCWFHKHSNVLAVLPKSAYPGVLAAMKETIGAEDIGKAQVAIAAFERDCGAKYPKAVAKIVDVADVLLESRRRWRVRRGESRRVQVGRDRRC